ncbi:MAG: zinc-ribbon domain-containing protein, partial [Deltaproteobacteria bacterium]|nr:zinc-ribbon domain-containing protein [Deltaproteobacteria bacterium]
MIIKCEKCGHKYQLDSKKIQGSKVSIKCSACGHRFIIRKPDDKRPSLAADHSQPQGDSTSPADHNGSEAEHPKEADQPLSTVDLSRMEQFFKPADEWDPDQELDEPSISVDLSQLDRYVDESRDRAKEVTYQAAEPMPAPVILPGSGKYNLAQLVTISCSVSDANIRYTTDGSDPDERSPRYLKPFEITESVTVKARAFKPGWEPSEIAAEKYEIIKKVMTPSFSLGSGKYTSAQTLTISCPTPEADIHFTSDGSEPTFNSPSYQFPIGITKSVTIIARAYKPGWQPSKIAKAIYEITGTVATPTFFVEPGTYTEPQMVNILCATPKAEIHYTTDENEPTRAMAKYTEPIKISQSTKLSARAFKAGWVSSELMTGYYEITGKVQIPTFSIQSGTFTTTQRITISCPTPEASVHYTSDGTIPNADSPVYSEPLEIQETTTIKARAFRDGWAPSDVAAASYRITGTVAKPTFSLKPGKYFKTQQVVLSSATPEAQIYYTLDGTYPTEDSILYLKPVNLTKSAALKARAFLTDWGPSEVTEADYHITGAVERPILSLAPGRYMSDQTLSISCLTPDAQIHYTLDGTEPTESSQQYIGPIELNKSATVSARAFKSDWEPSEIVSAAYEIRGVAAPPEFSLPPGEYTARQTLFISCVTPKAEIR